MWACARPSISTPCSRKSDLGPSRHSCRLVVADGARVSRLDDPASRAARGHSRCRVLRCSAVGALDADIYGSGSRVRGAVLPAVPARRGVRQVDGRFRLRCRDRRVHDRPLGAATRDPGGRPRRRTCHLRRSEPVRRVLCHRTDGTGALPLGLGPEAPAPGGNRARHVDLHDVGIARNARNSERDSDALFRHDRLCCPGAWHRCLRDYAGLRYVVARTARTTGASRRRRAMARTRPRRIRIPSGFGNSQPRRANSTRPRSIPPTVPCACRRSN